MAKVLVAERSGAPEAPLPEGMCWQGRVFAAVTAERFPLELHHIELAPPTRPFSCARAESARAGVRSPWAPA